MAILKFWNNAYGLILRTLYGKPEIGKCVIADGRDVESLMTWPLLHITNTLVGNDGRPYICIRNQARLDQELGQCFP